MAAIPIVDLLLIISLFTGAGLPFVIYFFAFLLRDLVLALLACWIEEEPLSQAAVYHPDAVLLSADSEFCRLAIDPSHPAGRWVGWG